MNKAEIRIRESARRLALTEAEVIQRSEQLLEQFKKLDFSAVKTLHIFLPITEKKEPDTFKLINWIKSQHPDINIIIPKADFTSSLMTHHHYGGEEELEKSLFNILEPILVAEYTGTIDMVIIPLLAFDRKGYRVGYGKGFYDRFLAAHNALKVGLSLFESVDTISDIHANDVCLDLCLTPEQIVYF